MNLKDFDYHLPKSLIAQKPIRPRDHSRLLVVSRRGAINAAHSNKNNVFRRGTANSAHSNSKNKEIKIEHKHFYDIIDYLRPGDVLVLNNSKVFPARLIGRKAETGGRIEVFLLGQDSLLFSPLSRGRVTSSSSFTRRRDNNFPPLAKSLPRTGYGGRGRVGREVWSCLLGGHGRKEGLKVEFGKGLKAEVIRNNQDGIWLVKFNMPYKKMMRVVEKIGQTPLPPYIKRSSKLKALRQSWLRPPKAGPPWAEIRPWRKSSKLNRDILSYQTIYADENRVGSVAAPTAGFHFTKELLEKIKNKGVQIEFITLHIGFGTFAPVKVDDVRKHKMHPEWVEIKKDVARRILEAKKEGRRIIAVGTTSARALEGILPKYFHRKLIQIPNSRFPISNFIYPGHKFKIVDALITNFHLPKSTLLMLASAFMQNNVETRHCLVSTDGIKAIKKIYKEVIKKKYRFYSYGDAMFIY